MLYLCDCLFCNFFLGLLRRIRLDTIVVSVVIDERDLMSVFIYPQACPQT